MGNVNSLPNKCDELLALVRNQRLYRECSLMCFTETWLNDNVPDSCVNLPGFSTVRADRNAMATGKNKGGGLMLLVNNRWCHPGHVTVKEKICCQDIELLAVGLRPYYVPREFSHIVAIVVYIPPRAACDVACDVIHETVAKIQNKHPSAFIAITGDFNNTIPSSHLTGFVQYVDCPTRENKTLDLFYGNAKEAYTAAALPPLGRSDHNLVFLQPIYKPCVLKVPVTTRSVRKWSPETSEALRDCFDCTDWTVLLEPQDNNMDMDRMVDTLTEYMNFCRDTVVPVKSVRCYPNNKPWVNSTIKQLLNRKKLAFKEGNKERLREVQHELKGRLRQAKVDYKRKVESKLQQNNIREVWKGMRTITGYSKKNGQVTDGDVDRANNLNLFFNRFDGGGCVHPTPASIPPTIVSAVADAPAPLSPGGSPSPTTAATVTATSSTTDGQLPLSFTADEVRAELRRLRTGKAAGPDGVCPRLLKDCAAQLAEPLQWIFNRSLQTCKVPVQWKTSCLVPVPKVGRPAELNDYRPVALTSHIMKTLERLVLRVLRSEVTDAMDPLQFAYQEHLGVEDAVLYMLHRVYAYLEEPGCCVRILFLDFSSAFNTIQPLILKDKMEGMGVDSSLTSWITDYLTERPQYVRLESCVSGMVRSSTGAPQGTVLAPFLFTLYTADFKYNTEFCHIQKYSDDTAIVACIRGGQEQEYRDLVDSFRDWCNKCCLHLNTAKTKEMVVDFRRKRPSHLPVFIQGGDIEMVHTYKYLGVLLDDKLDWSPNTDALYRKGQSRLFFLRTLRSFDVCVEMMAMFYHTVVASALFFAAVCWGDSLANKNTERLDKLVKKAGSVLGRSLDPLRSVVERDTLNKLRAIMDNSRHPLHSLLEQQRSSCSGRLLSLRCRTERFRRSFVPTAIRLFNSS